jgi:hypothetical protein
MLSPLVSAMAEMTIGWLVYRLREDRPEFLGLYQTQQKAKEDLEIAQTKTGARWELTSVPFVGWGYVAPGVFSQKGRSPLKVVE